MTSLISVPERPAHRCFRMHCKKEENFSASSLKTIFSEKSRVPSCKVVCYFGDKKGREVWIWVWMYMWICVYLWKDMLAGFTKNQWNVYLCGEESRSGEERLLDMYLASSGLGSVYVLHSKDTHFKNHGWQANITRVRFFFPCLFPPLFRGADLKQLRSEKRSVLSASSPIEFSP